MIGTYLFTGGGQKQFRVKNIVWSLWTQWRTLIKGLFSLSSPGVTGINNTAVMWGWTSSVISLFIFFLSATWRLLCSSASFPFFSIHILLCLVLDVRSKLTGAAAKESIAMFSRNLRLRLLVGPVRGSVIMGVDPGFKHGCKIAILSPTSKWPQTTASIGYW